MENKFYIYVLKDPITFAPFYVGKGTGNRMTSHAKIVKRGKVANKNNYSLTNKLKQLLESNADPIYEKPYQGLSEETAYELEAQLIEKIGLENLCNIAKGGLGGKTTTVPWNKGKSGHCSEETLIKMRNAKLGTSRP